MAEELRILYEDPYLVVCVKPVGVLSEDSESGRSLPRMLGDIRYGSKDPGCTAALWSYHLGFRHPVTGKPVDVTCPPPQVYPWDLFGGVK